MGSSGGEHKSHAPSPSLWPVGFAVGIAILLAGLIVNWFVVVLGAVIALVFGFLWVRDASSEMREHDVEVEPEQREIRAEAEPEPETVVSGQEPQRYTRGGLLTAGTIGIGAAIGAVVTVPVLGFAVVPAFIDQPDVEVDVGAIEKFPEGKFVITTFLALPEQGEVSRRTAYIRRNAELNGEPSFTIVSNRCVHLGCPVQPNGLPDENLKESEQIEVDGVKSTVDRIPVQPAGFGCPCHGGQYDTEGNRTAGPPVRSLDRYAFAIRNTRLILLDPFSVGNVDGEAENAVITRYNLAGPGEHVDGIEALLYPIQAPS